MDKQRKEYDLGENKIIGRREQHHNASRRDKRMELKERRRKQHLLPEMSFEKESLGEGSNGVVGKPTTKRVSLLWAYGKHLEI